MIRHMGWAKLQGKMGKSFSAFSITIRLLKGFCHVEWGVNWLVQLANRIDSNLTDWHIILIFFCLFKIHIKLINYHKF